MLIPSPKSQKKASSAVSCHTLMQLRFLLKNFKDFKPTCVWAGATGVSPFFGYGIQNLYPGRKGRVPGSVGPGGQCVALRQDGVGQLGVRACTARQAWSYTDAAAGQLTAAARPLKWGQSGGTKPLTCGI